jgi:hypothetical protein
MFDVCTDHGIEKFELKANSKPNLPLAKWADHCPLCQIQSHLAPGHLGIKYVEMISKSQLPAIVRMVFLQTILDWSFLPSRAPPLFTQ